MTKCYETTAGVFLHVLADALGSVVVIISALVIWLTDWEYRYLQYNCTKFVPSRAGGRTG